MLTLSRLLKLFKRLNLSSLPTANPGNGNPWLHSSGSVVVGTFTASSVSWSSITGVPATFPPSAHSHVITDVSGLQTALDAKLPTTGGTLDGDLTVVGNIYAPTIFQGGAMVLTVDDIDFTVMPYSANLSAIAALPGTSGLLRKTAANTWTLDTATYYTASQVDALVQGLDPKASVRVATTGNITLSGTQTIDGVALNIGDRVLAKNQTTQSQNGIRVVAAGAWPRAADMDVWTEVPGAYVFVEEGTVNADTGWVCTSNAGGTIDSTAIVFGQFAGAGTVTSGSGITVTGNQVSVDSSVVTLTGVQTLTNKTLTSPTLTTPNIGAATGTSLVLSAGLTVGSNIVSSSGIDLTMRSASSTLFGQVNSGTQTCFRAGPAQFSVMAIALGSNVSAPTNWLWPDGAGTVNVGTSISNSSGSLNLTNLTSTGIVQTPAITLSGNVSRAAWTTGGVGIAHVNRTLTDTSSTGTVAAAYTNVLGGNTIAASNAVTFTEYASLFLGSPVAGTNVTITNPYSLVTAGAAKFGGNVQASGYVTATNGLYVGAGSSSFREIGNSNLLIAAGSGNNLNLRSTGILVGRSNLILGIVSGTDATTGSPDVSQSRASSGVWQFGDGGANANGSLNLANLTASGSIRPGQFTVATLPSAAANTGRTVQVTDSSVDYPGNIGSTVAGGGSFNVDVKSNGTNWRITG